ncbi:MAG: preprotein translocase subunit YajC [Lachnospiraceae bacterium]|nr:preprotein translocase subunit YajC [Lachnospiraceae bacterium]
MFLEAGAGATAGGGILSMVLLIGFWIILFYFMIIKPQKKQQKAKEELYSAMEPGDSIMTTSGFYGTILDIDDSTVIVEFGNNKNCRIPMHKSAIAEVEKAGSAVVSDDDAE